MIAGTFTTNSPDETFELGRRLGEQLTASSVLLLKGDLGSGKTLFTKGVAEGLGIDNSEVTSPSFTLVNEYQGRLKLYHIDLYRFSGDTGVPRLGLEEIFSHESAITVVEWAERLAWSPQNARMVEFRYVSDTSRQIIIGASPA